MDIALIRRRSRPSDDNYGMECWLLGVYPPGEGTPILAITNHPGDITYDGVTYTAYNCAIVPPDTDAEYALPGAQIRISNVLRALITSLHANDFYRNYEVEIIPYNTEETGAAYSTDVNELVWVSHKMDQQDLIVTLGVPGELTRSVPADLYASHNCRHRFRLSAGVYGQRCGYTAPAIVSVTLTPGGAIVIGQTGHLYSTGDLVEISGTGGLTPDLDDYYTVTNVNANSFSLDGTVGDDYSGAWDSNGKAGFYTCEQYRAACVTRGRLVSFGGLAGMRSDALRVGV